MPSPSWPKNSPPLSGKLLEKIDQSAQELATDSLMLWLCLDDEDCLISVYNPTLPELCGFKQPLDRGLISQVLLTGLPILESNLKEHLSHDPTLDQIHKRATRAMIAAPIATPEKTIGILSAVQFTDTTQQIPFQLSHLDQLTRLAEQITPEIARCLA